MPKFFTKKQFFAFLASFSITLAVGIFAWFVIFNSESILNQISNKIDSIFFGALSLPNSEVKEIFPAANTENFDEEYELNLEEPPVDESLNIYTGVGGPDPVLMSEQDILDDITEKIDIIQQQVNELTKESQNSEKTEKTEENEEKEEVKEDENKHDEEVEETAIIYSKVLIHETKISPIEQRFIKLYNPNDVAVDLTGWYLQRKTATGLDYTSCVSKNDFFGKTILPGGYFLISRENSSADIFMPDLVLTESNYLTLKNPRGEISDAAKTALENFIVASASSGGGSPAPVIYPKILISEAQIAPIGQRFFELYNPNDFDVDLAGWYIQRKTKTSDSWASFVSSSKFEGKTISAKSYFLIASLDLNPDIDSDLTISDDNSFVLKDPNRDISDKLGFGLAQDFELAPAAGPEKGQSIGRKWDATNNIEQDTDDNLSDFEIQEPSPKALNTAYVVPEEPPLILTDTTAPEVSFTLDALQTSLFFTINFEITDILGTVTPSGIDSYIFRWQEEGGSWQEDSPVKVNEGPSFANLTREFIEGLDEKTYNFQIKVKDIAGNESAWLPETPASTKISIPKKVLINEIQIDSIDGAGGTNDDWVELYNPNDFDIDLIQWSIQRSPESGTIYKKNFETGQKISAKSYFLIVRNNAKQELLDIADMACSALQLSDNSAVYLVKNQEDITDGNDSDIVDKVGFGITAFSSETSPALTPPDGKSIARKELGLDTDDNSQDFIISETPTPKADNF